MTFIEGRSSTGEEESPVMIHDLRMLLNGNIDNGGFRATWPSFLLSIVLLSAAGVSASGITDVVDET